MEKKKKSLAVAIRKRFERKRDSRIRWLYAFTASISVAIFILFWCTNVFHDAILSNLELRNGTPTFLYWQQPPVDLTVKVYVFNYTNLKEFESGNATRLRVQEVGPFVYQESLRRVNVQLHENKTVTYQEKRSYRWISGLSEDEIVIVPNVLLISALAKSRNLMYIMQIMLTTMLSSVGAKPFLELTVGEYLWGYEDELFEMAKLVAPAKQPIAYDKFGILAMKNGVSADRITIHTGIDDLRNLGMIQRINGMEHHHVWEDEHCDRIYGTDGSMFPPHWIAQPNNTLYVYVKDACRRLPLVYERRGFANGIPTLRYKLPSNVFTPTTNKDSCFCPKESHDSLRRTCPPVGTLNVSACKFGSPMLVSFPHFYAGDESLFQRIEGLEPDQERHESYIELHPRLGIVVDTKMRFQLNLEVQKAVGVPFSGSMEDGSILPLIWMDSGIEEMPEAMQKMFYHSHYLVNAIEAGFQWCSLVAAILSFGAFLTALKRDRPVESKPATPLTDRSEISELSELSLP
ncbi:scavenger receptor class B member 1-like [Osmia bicornis bicornis]|uniref:scavenger receptor class B member 1-like n=1 Tax=Osmia bicornis bicornis TaxID=1437191 RepID=UPI0010F870C6|nr:scavenger receptor class B member 1-like [Osmia bicornis bicornis]